MYILHTYFILGYVSRWWFKNGIFTLVPLDNLKPSNEKSFALLGADFNSNDWAYVYTVKWLEETIRITYQTISELTFIWKFFIFQFWITFCNMKSMKNLAGQSSSSSKNSWKFDSNCDMFLLWIRHQAPLTRRRRLANQNKQSCQIFKNF